MCHGGIWAGCPVSDGWVLNNNDTDDDCASNIHDCFYVCDGTALVDDCDVCDGDNADQDCAGVCFGDAYIDNCDTCDSDSLNDCEQDCAGVWGGDAEVSDFYTDSDEDGLGTGDANQYCGVISGSFPEKSEI